VQAQLACYAQHTTAPSVSAPTAMFVLCLADSNTGCCLASAGLSAASVNSLTCKVWTCPLAAGRPIQQTHGLGGARAAAGPAHGVNEDRCGRALQLTPAYACACCFWCSPSLSTSISRQTLQKSNSVMSVCLSTSSDHSPLHVLVLTLLLVCWGLFVSVLQVPGWTSGASPTWQQTLSTVTWSSTCRCCSGRFPSPAARTSC
jgi:hypothetical protein